MRIFIWHWNSARSLTCIPVILRFLLHALLTFMYRNYIRIYMYGVWCNLRWPVRIAVYCTVHALVYLLLFYLSCIYFFQVWRRTISCWGKKLWNYLTSNASLTHKPCKLNVVETETDFNLNNFEAEQKWVVYFIVLLSAHWNGN